MRLRSSTVQPVVVMGINTDLLQNTTGTERTYIDTTPSFFDCHARHEVLLAPPIIFYFPSRLSVGDTYNTSVVHSEFKFYSTLIIYLVYHATHWDSRYIFDHILPALLSPFDRISSKHFWIPAPISST